jgi:Putative Actinobacterial Holin-X, holin superfamily III
MADGTRPLASLATRVISDVAYLVQTEIRLARAEITQKLSRAARGGVLVGVAAILLLPGIFILLLDAARWVEVAGLPQEWSMLLVGGLTVVVGIALAVAGANRLKGSALVPDQTIEQVRADIGVAKEHV